MQNVLIVIHLLIVLALVGAILLQRSEGGGLGIGGGGGGGAGFMSGRGAANMLTRTTAFLAVGFFATSIFLTILSRGGGTPTSIIDGAVGTGTPGTEQSQTTDTLGGDGEGLLNTLQGIQENTGPQVPQSQ